MNDRSRNILPALMVLVVLMGPMSLPLGSVSVLADLKDPGSLMDHDPVTINGNTDFTTSDAVVAGDGSLSTPYIIENWTIVANTSHGISISNTDAHFTVRNCHLLNGSHGATNDGIYLFNVSNGTLEDSRMNENRYGVHVHSSNNITVLDNSINSSSSRGIYIHAASDIVVENNTVFDNGLHGMDVGDGSQYVTLQNNTVINNTGNGIQLVGSSVSNTVQGNDIRDGSDNGVYIGTSSDNNSILDNDIHNNSGHGLEISGSRDMTVKNNNIANNSWAATPIHFGLYLLEAEENEIFNNTLVDNGFNLGIEGQDFADFNNTLGTNNTADGRAVHYLVNDRDKTVPSDAGFVALVGCDNITVGNATLVNNQYGVLLFETSNSTIGNVTVNNTIFGVHMASSPRSVLHNSTITNVSYGVFLKGNSYTSMVRDNKMRDLDYGIYRDQAASPGWLTSLECIRNEMYEISHDGINILKGNKIGLRENLIEDGQGHGILLNDTDDSILAYNEISNMTLDGISVVGNSVNITIEGNEIHNNSRNGVDLHSSSINHIENNAIRDNAGHGIDLNGTAQSNWVVGNNISYNDHGISMVVNSDSNDLNGNRIFNNSYGVYISNSDSNTIYNNYLNNTINHLTSGSTGNVWNISKTSGMNIVKGLFLGGNYWSDYTGSDTDGDYLGDTNLPHGPGDNLPLLMAPDLIPPGVRDDTSDIPSTGDNLTVNVSAWDHQSGISGVSINYTIDGHASTNISLMLDTGDPQNGTYTTNIDIPEDGKRLDYFILANDTADNWNITSNVTLSILDDDAPEMVDNTTGCPTTGDTFVLVVNVTDNINLSSVRVEYIFDTGYSDNVTMNISGGLHMTDLQVPENATSLQYRLMAKDNSSNWAFLPYVDLTVRDNDPPEVTDLSTIPYNGENVSLSFLVKDNIYVDEVWVEYSFDDGPPVNLSLVENAPLHYETNVTVPLNVSVLHYSVFVNDTAGNSLTTPDMDVEVKDETLPTLTDLSGTPMNDIPFEIACNATDNIEIDRVRMRYRYDGGEFETVNLNLSDVPDVWRTVIAVPEDVAQLRYEIRAFDDSNNLKVITRTVDVMDGILPVIIDKTGQPSTGDDLTFFFQVSDNRNLSGVHLEFAFDGSPSVNETYDGPFTITVPPGASTLEYTLSATDTSNNTAVLSREMDIVDNDAPDIRDTSATPTTGDDFPININYEDNRGIEEVYLEYWFDRGEETNVSYTRGFTVTIPEGALRIGYRFVAIDHSNNLAQCVTQKDVVDNDLPTITDRSTEPETGRPFRMVAGVQDNVMVQQVRVEYSFDDSESLSFQMRRGRDGYFHQVDVPENAMELTYSILATDIQGNPAELRVTVDILDATPPVIQDETGTPTTGDEFAFQVQARDNRGAIILKIRYAFDGSPPLTAQYGDGLTVKVPSDAKSLEYEIMAEDVRGNAVNLSNEISVTDNDPPSVEEINTGSAEANGRLNVEAHLQDNIGISQVRIEYWYGDGNHKTETMDLKDGVYVANIDVPNEPEISFSISVLDEAGNEITSETHTVLVEGYIGITSMIGYALAIIVVVIVVLLAVSRRRKSKREFVPTPTEPPIKVMGEGTGVVREEDGLEEPDEEEDGLEEPDEEEDGLEEPDEEEDGLEEPDEEEDGLEEEIGRWKTVEDVPEPETGPEPPAPGEMAETLEPDTETSTEAVERPTKGLWERREPEEAYEDTMAGPEEYEGDRPEEPLDGKPLDEEPLDGEPLDESIGDEPPDLDEEGDGDVLEEILSLDEDSLDADEMDEMEGTDDLMEEDDTEDEDLGLGSEHRCTKCGKELLSSYNVCPYCGADLK